MLPNCTRAVLLAGALGVALSAQGPIGTNHRVIPWDHSISAPSFREVAVGDFTGDDRVSIVARTETRLAFLFDPSLYTSVSEIPTAENPTGISVIKHPVLVDRLLVAFPNSVMLGDRQVDGTWNMVPVSGLGPLWHGAHDINRRRQLGSSTDLISAISATGSVLIGLVQPNGIPTHMAQITPPTPAREAVLVDFDGDTVLDVVLRTDTRVWAYDTGGVIWGMPLATGNAVATFLPGEPGGERLVTVEEDALGVFYLVVRDINGPEAPAILAVPGLTPGTRLVALRSLDFDSDGDYDVVLTHAGSHDGLVFENRIDPAQTTAFVTGQPTLVAPALTPDPGGAAANQCAPAWHDFDRNGTPDLVVASEGAATVGLVFDAPIVPFVAGNVEWVIRAEYDGAKLSITLDPAVISGFTAIEYVAWEQANPYVNAPPMDSDAKATAVHTIASLGPTPILEVPMAPAGGDIDGAEVWPLAQHYYVEMRGILAAGDASASYIFGVTMKNNQSAGFQDYLGYLKSITPGEVKKKIDVKRQQRTETVGGIIIRVNPPILGEDPPTTGS